MRTILKDEQSELEISDEGFDSPLSWLRLKIIGGEENHDASIEIPLRELLGALIGFDAKRNKFEEEINN